MFASVGCGTSNNATPAAAPDAGADSDSAAPESNDVVVKVANTYGFADGKLTEKLDPYGVTTGTITADVDGKSTVFTPTKRDDGALVFASVPRAPYLLELRTTYSSAPAGDPPRIVQYPIDGARSVLIGGDYWTRQDTTAMTDDTKLALSIEAPKGIQSGDRFSWLGVHSYFYRTAQFFDGEVDGIANPPAEDATSSKDWTFDSSVLGLPYTAEASGLPVAAAKDDLAIVQNRTATLTTTGDPSDPLARFGPWRRFSNDETIGVLHVASPDFANGKTNTVTGTLAAPTTEHLTLSLYGSSYAAIRAAAGYPDTTTSYASMSLSQEAGPGPAVFTSVAPTAWSLSASAKRKPIDLTCFPNPTTPTCDPSVCAVGCAAATKGYLDPDDLVGFELDSPLVHPTGLRGLYSASYSFSLPIKLADGSSRTLSAGVNEARPKTTDKPTFRLELGPPTNILFDGSALAFGDGIDVFSADGAPTVSFTAPTQGAPEYYRIEVLDLTPDFGKEVERPRTLLSVALLHTRTTSVTLPKDGLRKGHTYYLRVHAIKDGWKFGERAPRETTARTGVFTAPFVFGE